LNDGERALMQHTFADASLTRPARASTDEQKTNITRRGPAVTANTHTQLETKTWAAIQKWHKLCLTASWFICTTGRLYHRSSKETWFCNAADVQGRELRSLRQAARRDLVLLLHF
jgi:hypothetical protein